MSIFLHHSQSILIPFLHSEDIFHLHNWRPWGRSTCLAMKRFQFIHWFLSAKQNVRMRKISMMNGWMRREWQCCCMIPFKIEKRKRKNEKIDWNVEFVILCRIHILKGNDKICKRWNWRCSTWINSLHKLEWVGMNFFSFYFIPFPITKKSFLPAASSWCWGNVFFVCTFSRRKNIHSYFTCSHPLHIVLSEWYKRVFQLNYIIYVLQMQSFLNRKKINCKPKD